MAISSKVICDCCKKLFTLSCADDIVECRTMDEYDREIAPREWVFACPKCLKKYTVLKEEDEE